MQARLVLDDEDTQPGGGEPVQNPRIGLDDLGYDHAHRDDREGDDVERKAACGHARWRARQQHAQHEQELPGKGVEEPAMAGPFVQIEIGDLHQQYVAKDTPSSTLGHRSSQMVAANSTSSTI